MRVAFHDGTVHECPRVTFVGIADYIFDVRYAFPGKAPLDSCRESSASAATQSGTFHFVYDLFRSPVQKAVRQGFITIPCDVFLYVLRVDESAVPQGNALLLAVEVHMFGVADMLPGLRVQVQQPLDFAPGYDMFIDNLLRVFRLYLCVESVVRYYLDYRAFFTEAETACGDYVDPV